MDSRHNTWAASKRLIPTRFVRPFVRFTRIEASSGLVLLGAAVVAIIWANSPISDLYERTLETHLNVDLGGFAFDQSVHAIINDGLMAIFFFVVGLEIKRELVLGELRDRKAATLPIIAALGGMVGPAAIYLLLNAGAGGEAIRGWGVPMATDIAFAVGVVALLGSRIPGPAKLFLLALAIADDIGAIAVIAIFYTSGVDLGYLALAVGALASVWLAQRVGIRSLTFYVPVAVLAWFFTFESGVHATLAGVALGFLTPAHPMYKQADFDSRARSILDQYPIESEEIEGQEQADHEALLLSKVAAESVSPLTRVEHRLVPWSSFLIVPLFALANAGVDLRGTSIVEALTSPIGLGVALGLVVGKIAGISLFAFAGVRLGLGRLPDGTGWLHLVGLAAVAGIGFTVSLFVAELAFSDRELIDLAKVGIFIGSLAAGLIGAALLTRAKAPAST
ncbi:MAG: Na+/H+ antiporter NhaA [Acidimicrobiia bacterium]